MLGNLLFSINISLPLFLMMGLGYLLMRKGMFTDDYMARTTNLLYYIMVPAKLFLDTANIDLASAFDGRYAAVALAGGMLQFAVAWCSGNLFCRDRRKQSAFSHACFRGNLVYLGMTLLQNIFGTEEIATFPVMLAVILPMYNIQGVILMSVKENSGKLELRKILFGILKNPIILAILAGLPFAYFHIELPFLITKCCTYMGNATSGLALLLVGSSFNLGAARSDKGLLGKISAIKLLVMPAIWAVLAILAGLTNAQIVTLTIVGAIPAGTNVYIVTDKMGGDGTLAVSALVITQLASLFTMTGIIFLLRSFGLV